MGRITSFSKQVIVFFLVTALIIRPTFAANVGGWSLGNPVSKGASVVYDATKNVVINGKDFIKDSWVKITPTASQVSKVLARGVAGYALSVAVEQLLGAVDWVLDAENNQIKYKAPEDGKQELCWLTSSYTGCYSTAEQAASASCLGAQVYYNNGQIAYANCADGSLATVQSGLNPNYDPEAAEEKKLPLDVVSQRVISNAEANDTNAQVATTAAAADVVAEAEKDEAKARPIANQAEANAQTKPADEAEAEKANEAQGQSKPNEANPEATDISLEFPVFCSWAPIVCEAAQVVISFPQTLTEWWETANSWALSISEAWTKVKEEYADKPEENTDTELDIPDQSPPDINTDISFGGSCPASRSVPVSFAGIHTEIEFSFQWFCEVASIAKPVVISISAFASALIVAGVRTEDD